MSESKRGLFSEGRRKAYYYAVMVKYVEKKGNNDGSESLGSVAPFLKKCYEIVDDEATDSIISWSETNDCFIISDMTQFSVQLLPKYFKHSNFSSFMRQLNIYVSVPFLVLVFLILFVFFFGFAGFFLFLVCYMKIAYLNLIVGF